MAVTLFFLDDDPGRTERFVAMATAGGYQVVTAPGYEAAETALRQHKFDVCFLDHDLGDVPVVDSDVPERTVYHVARLVVALPADRRPSRVVVHSHNPIGALRMVELLHATDIPAVHRPFGWRLSQVV
jgi:CheY-like chemotaxis protein